MYSAIWSRIMDALAAAHDASVQMIDTSIVRVHQHGACIIREPKAVNGAITRRADQQEGIGSAGRIQVGKY